MGDTRVLSLGTPVRRGAYMLDAAYAKQQESNLSDLLQYARGLPHAGCTVHDVVRGPDRFHFTVSYADGRPADDGFALALVRWPGARFGARVAVERSPTDPNVDDGELMFAERPPRWRLASFWADLGVTLALAAATCATCCVAGLLGDA